MILFNPTLENYPIPLNSFQKEVFEFCQEWKSGKNTFLFNTSGSTGSPKPIFLLRSSMIKSAHMTGDWLNLNEGDNVLLALPITYIAGAMMLVRSLVLHLNVILIEPSQNPLTFLKNNIKIHLASFVSTQWHTIIHSNLDLQHLFLEAKGILIGGSGISRTDELLTKNIKCPVFNTYGMTETASHIAFRTLNDANKAYQILPNVSIKLNEHQCLSIKSPSTNELWIETNDVAEIIDKHHFFILGRKDNIINSGGRKIQPEIVEQFCHDYFSCHLVPTSLFACGISDEFYGQKLVLFIESDFKFNKQKELLDFLKMKLKSWEIPKEIINLSRFLYTRSGKIDQANTLILYFKNLNLPI